MLFNIIEGAKAVLVSKGLYKQVDLYSRGGKIFAAWGSGFIGLRQDQKGTTLPNVRWDHVEGIEYEFGEFGVMLDAKHRYKKAA